MISRNQHQRNGGCSGEEKTMVVFLGKDRLGWDLVLQSLQSWEERNRRKLGLLPSLAWDFIRAIVHGTSALCCPGTSLVPGNACPKVDFPEPGDGAGDFPA